MSPANRAKSAALWVRSRPRPWAYIVATMLASCTCLPPIGMVFSNVSRFVVTPGPSSATWNWA
jgi:hypothetical protein